MTEVVSSPVLSSAQSQSQPISRMRARPAFLLVAIVVIGIAAIRARMLSVPLDRDEGEYAYAGQLILHGAPPYLHAYNMKLPGVYYFYALFFLLFGESIQAVHLGLLLINAATIFAMFFLGRMLRDPPAGAMAAITYGLLSISPGIFGFHAEATQFVVFFAVLGVCSLLAAIRRSSGWLCFAAGLLFGFGFLMKQHGIIFIFFGIFWLLWSAWRNRQSMSPELMRALILLGGSVLPFAVICLLLYAQGVFRQFWFWTFTYAARYATNLTWHEGWHNFRADFLGRVLPAAISLWVLTLIGLAALFTKAGRKYLDFISWLLIFSALGCLPGLYFRQHYFVLLLPAAALAVGVGLSLLRDAIPQTVAIVIFAAGSLAFVFQQRDYLFRISPVEEVQQLFFANPFPEAIPVANYIRQHSTSGDRIAVLGSEPEIYFYADRLSASGYIYMYGLMEEQPLARQMQQDFFRETEAAKPKFVVFVNVAPSWLAQPGSVRDLRRWLPEFLKDYRVEGVINIHRDKPTEYYWGAQAAQVPNSNTSLIVYRRLVE